MIQLKVPGALHVHRLRGYDAVPARVLGEPPFDVEDHTVDHDPAPAALVVLHDLAPRPDPPSALVLSQPIGAVLRERRQPQRVRSLGELLHDPYVVLGRGPAERFGLEPDENPVERRAVNLRVALGPPAAVPTARCDTLRCDTLRCLPLPALPGAHRGSVRARLAYRPSQRDARPEQTPVHRERLPVARVDRDQLPRGGGGGGGRPSPRDAVHQSQTSPDGDADAPVVVARVVHRVNVHAGVRDDASPVAVVPKRDGGVCRVNRVAPRHPHPERRRAQEREIVPIARVG